MPTVDMAHLVAEHERQFRLVIHKAEQLARDVDAPAGHGEGVVDGRV
jgi:hypothetical protein